jgi:hypothetical protein
MSKSSVIFEIGDAVRLQGSFSDIDRALTDPSTVTFKVRDPSTTLNTYVYSNDVEVFKAATGIYYMDFVVNTVGQHNWRLEGTGSVQVAEQDFFTARSLNV